MEGPGRGVPAARTPDGPCLVNQCAGKKKDQSRRALLFYIRHKRIGSPKNASPSLGYIFRRPFNFLCLGVLYAQNEGF